MSTIRNPPLAIVKRRLTQEEHERHILMMWLMFLRAPGKQTAPGEPVDLGEIGAVCEKKWSRLSPYSIAQPKGFK